MNFPADVDHFVIDLVESATIDIAVESANFDPFVRIGYPGAREEQWVTDDNSGQGIFGLNAKLTYRAPHTGSYFIQISNSQFADTGGYILTVNNAPPGAVPVPIPAGPELIDSPFGPMEVYESAQYPFSIQHPAGWTSQPQVQIGATAQFIGEGGEQFVIAEEDVVALGLQEMSLNEYVDTVLSVLESTVPGIELVSRKTSITAQGMPAEILEFSLFNGQFLIKRFIVILNNRIGFSATYVAPKDKFSELEPVAEYSFGSFRVEGLPVTNATPSATPEPAKTIAAADTLTVATRALRTGSGTPRFCTAGCSETVYLSGMMETLTGVDAGPNGPLDPQNTPMLAESWQLSSDLSYVDFKLRKGVQFHKGWGEMTAQDVAFSFNDANAAVNQDSIHGQAGDFAPFIKNVEATDTYTVRFNFTMIHQGMPLRYIGPFYQSAGIVSNSVFDRYGPEGMHQLFIGTGPFEFVEWRKNESLIVDAVDEHWRQVPAVKRVRYLDIPESTSRVAMLEVGEAQIAGELPFLDVVRLQKSGFRLQRDNGYSQELSLFMSGNYWEDTHPQSGRRLLRTRDTSKPWVGDPADPRSMERSRKVRWALAMTIDRESLNRSVIQGLGEVCYLNQISINQAGWQGKWEIPFDPERARQLLKEAGYEGGGFAVDLWIGPGGVRVELAEAIAALWLKELGVSTNLDRNSYTKYRPGLVQRTTSTFFFSAGDEGKTGFPVHWPKGLQGSAITDGGWGPGFEDPFYSQSFFKMNAEPDENRRLAMAEDYFDHVYDVMLQPCVVEVPLHPMYNPKEITAWSPHPSMNGNLSGVNGLETVVLSGGRRPAATNPDPTPTPAPAPDKADLKLEIAFKGDAFEFDKDRLTAPPGAEVNLKLTNTSSVNQHNWVLVKAGTKDEVAAAGTAVGPRNDWIPQGDSRIIAQIGLLDPGQVGEVGFTVPTDGAYQFVCTFPGHNFTEFGTFVVERYFQGRTLILSVVTIDRAPELRYTVVEYGVEKFVSLTPSENSLELVVLHLKVQNHTANVAKLDIGQKSAELIDALSNSYFPIDVADMARYSNDPPEPGDHSYKILALETGGTISPSKGFLRGPVDLAQGEGLDGWMIFEAPKGAEFSEFGWLTGDTMYIPIISDGGGK
jgi:ABC-type transport system substrate-binding protein/azurin